MPWDCTRWAIFVFDPPVSGMAETWALPPQPIFRGLGSYDSRGPWEGEGQLENKGRQNREKVAPHPTSATQLLTEGEVLTDWFPPVEKAWKWLCTISQTLCTYLPNHQRAGFGFALFSPSNNFCVRFLCCVSNDHRLSGLKQHTLSHSSYGLGSHKVAVKGLVRAGVSSEAWVEKDLSPNSLKLLSLLPSHYGNHGNFLLQS